METPGLALHPNGVLEYDGGDRLPRLVDNLDPMAEAQTAAKNLLASQTAGAAQRLPPGRFGVGKLHPLVIESNHIVINVEEEPRHGSGT